MKRLNTKGFGAVEILLSLVLVGVIGGVGWYVWKQRTNNSSSTTIATTTSTQATTPKTATTTYTVPAGYIAYENKDVCFKFAYPKEYGSLTKSTSSDSSVENFYESSEPNTAYAPGAVGKISFSVTKNNGQTLTTYKYGPDVKMQNGRLIVVSVNPADEVNKVGADFKNLGTTSAGPTTKGDLKIFNIAGGDEGTSNYSFIFECSSKLVEINLPSFTSGSYLANGDSKPNDSTKYYQMKANILDSIQSN